MWVDLKRFEELEKRNETQEDKGQEYLRIEWKIKQGDKIKISSLGNFVQKINYKTLLLNFILINTFLRSFWQNKEWVHEKYLVKNLERNSRSKQEKSKAFGISSFRFNIFSFALSFYSQFRKMYFSSLQGRGDSVSFFINLTFYGGNGGNKLIREKKVIPEVD